MLPVGFHYLQVTKEGNNLPLILPIQYIHECKIVTPNVLFTIFSHSIEERSNFFVHSRTLPSVFPPPVNFASYGWLRWKKQAVSSGVLS